MDARTYAQMARTETHTEVCNNVHIHVCTHEYTHTSVSYNVNIHYARLALHKIHVYFRLQGVSESACILTFSGVCTLIARHFVGRLAAKVYFYNESNIF